MAKKGSFVAAPHPSARTDCHGFALFSNSSHPHEPNHHHSTLFRYTFRLLFCAQFPSFRRSRHLTANRTTSAGDCVLENAAHRCRTRRTGDHQQHPAKLSPLLSAQQLAAIIVLIAVAFADSVDLKWLWRLFAKIAHRTRVHCPAARAPPQ